MFCIGLDVSTALCHLITSLIDRHLQVGCLLTYNILNVELCVMLMYKMLTVEHLFAVVKKLRLVHFCNLPVNSVCGHRVQTNRQP